jgi:YbbR domain-containing protein
MLIIGIFIAIGLFYYIQKKNTDRNIEHFQRSREKYEQLLEQLRKPNNDSEPKSEPQTDN